jgi:hypothetical protein
MVGTPRSSVELFYFFTSLSFLLGPSKSTQKTEMEGMEGDLSFQSAHANRKKMSLSDRFFDYIHLFYLFHTHYNLLIIWMVNVKAHFSAFIIPFPSLFHPTLLLFQGYFHNPFPWKQFPQGVEGSTQTGGRRTYPHVLNRYTVY